MDQCFQLPTTALTEDHQCKSISSNLASRAEPDSNSSSTTSILTGSTSPVEIAWSFGCLLGSIFNKDPNDLNLSCIDNIPHKMQAIYKKCLSKNPQKRPSIKVLQEFLSSCEESLTFPSIQTAKMKDPGEASSHEPVTGIVINEALVVNMESQNKNRIAVSTQTSFGENNLNKSQVREEKQCGLKLSRSNRVKVKWDKMSECQYDRDSLERIFLKYGIVTGIVIFETKVGSALVEFESIAAARMAITEDGVLNNMIKVKPVWIDEGGITGSSQQTLGMAADDPSSAKHFCSLCSKMYAHKQHLRRHIKSAHSSTLEDLLPKKSFNCKSCSKSYDRLQYLQRHMQVHTVNKQKSQKPVGCQLPKPLKASQPKPLSAWEKVRRNNIKRNMLVLSSLDNEP